MKDAVTGELSHLTPGDHNEVSSHGALVLIVYSELTVLADVIVLECGVGAWLDSHPEMLVIVDDVFFKLPLALLIDEDAAQLALMDDITP